MSDWITLDNDFYRSTVGPVGMQLGLEYNYKTGEYQLKEQTFPVGFSIFYKNGVWVGDAQKDPKLFVDGVETPEAKQLAIDIKKATYAAFQTRGGSQKGNVVNASALPQNQNLTSPTQQGSNPGITSGPTFAGIAAALGLPSNIFEPGLGITDQYKNFTSVNEIDLFKGLLKYPKDILDLQQDTLHITMFNYKPPLEDLFEGNQTTASVFTKGVQRNSALLKDSIGTVILPIPAGISDSNNVEWGEDRMNNMTTAVTGAVSQNLGGAAATQMATALTGLAASLKDVKLPTGNINQLALLGMASSGLNIPELKTALMSMILKNAQFDVSPESILARGAGIVPNSNLELLFRGPTLRQFQFAYRFSPRSEPEAKDVRRIIRFFKQGSAARKLNASGGAGQGSVFLGSPNVFKLEYKTVGGKSITGVNKFKICALQGVSVNYAPDGQWSAYEEGQPVSYTMTLGFQEIEPIYESDYQDTIFNKNNIDLGNNYAKVTEDDIGY